MSDSLEDIIRILNSDNQEFKSILIKTAEKYRIPDQPYIETLSKSPENFDSNKENFQNKNKMETNDKAAFYDPNSSQSNFQNFYHNLQKIRYMLFKPLHHDLSLLSNKNYEDHGYYFKFYNGEIKLIKLIFEENGFKETSHNNFTIFWSIGPIKTEVYNSLTPYQKVNHFPKSYEITRKDYMYRNIAKMQGLFGFKNFNFVPKTFLLPTDLSLLKEDFEKKSHRQIYIVKPAASSQGKGIYLTDDIVEILHKQNNNMIVSHYIDDPFLINGYKFDLRIYVLITSINPLRIYVYQEGLVRFATIKYDINDIISKNNRFIHLTNYSVNKMNENFIAPENETDGTGSKWSLSAFKNYLQGQNINTDIIFDRIEEILVKSILSIESTICPAFETNVPYRNNCFELLGFDILLDSHLRPWLLEVNLSPSLNIDSPLDLKIKGELISDIFTMIGIVPNDQRTYQNLPINKAFQYANLVQEKKSEWVDNWNNYNFNEKESKEYNKEERIILKETEEEFQRKRNFKRIYPDHNALKYKPFFEINRHFNEILRNKETEKIKKNGQQYHSQKKY